MICGSCIDRPEVEVCPQCRIVLTGKLSRNRVLENIARKIFPEETVIDHVTTQEGIDEVTAQETNEFNRPTILGSIQPGPLVRL